MAGAPPPEPPNTTEKWLTAKQIGRMVNLDSRNVLDYARFGKQGFPKPIMKGRFHFWKYNTFMRWKFRNVFRIKKSVQWNLVVK